MSVAVTIESLIQTYGYLALFIGTIIEGETILIIAGFAAHQGYLNLWWVMVVAFLGSFTGDQCWYLVGRHGGRSLLAKRPSWQPKAARVRAILDRHKIPLMLGFRFLYGLRNVTPFVVGASGFRPSLFVPLNAAGAVIWSVLVSLAGYLFGKAVEPLFQKAHKYEIGLVILIAVAGVVIWIVHWVRKKRRPGGGPPDSDQGGDAH
jgi:membrane protein DedA with SNARE-associated domain